MGKQRFIKCILCNNLYSVTNWDSLKLCEDCNEIYYKKAVKEHTTVFDLIISKKYTRSEILNESESFKRN